MNIAEDEAWMIKYFMADSVDKESLLLIIKGTNEIKLISKPNQAENHVAEETEIIEPNKVIEKKMIFKLLKINKAYLGFITLWCISTKDFDSLGVYSLLNVIKIQNSILFILSR